MTLRRKTLIIIGATLVGLTAIMYAVSQTNLLFFMLLLSGVCIVFGLVALLLLVVGYATSS